MAQTSVGAVDDHPRGLAGGSWTRQIDTGFQIGFRRFSLLLVYVAAALTSNQPA
jgi:hypothetical protein